MPTKFRPTKSRRPYHPNHIPVAERVLNIILSALLLTYGLYSLITDSFYLPGRIIGKSSYFHGEPGWILFGAVLCVAALLLSLVVAHYDKRDNAKNYKRFVRIMHVAAWVFFIAALLLEEFVYQKSTDL